MLRPRNHQHPPNLSLSFPSLYPPPGNRCRRVLLGNRAAAMGCSPHIQVGALVLDLVCNGGLPSREWVFPGVATGLVA